MFFIKVIGFKTSYKFLIRASLFNYHSNCIRTTKHIQIH